MDTRALPEYAPPGPGAMTRKREPRAIGDAPGPYVADPAVAILAYIPKRRMAAAAAHPRDPTLQAGFIPPCLPMTAPAAPSGRLWLHEVKHDGFRIIARNDGQRVR